MDRPENSELSLGHDEFLVSLDGTSEIRVRILEDGKADVDGTPVDYSISSKGYGSGEFVLLCRHQVFRVSAEESAETGEPSDVRFEMNGVPHATRVDDRRTLLSRRFDQERAHASGEITIRAPMPGLVSKVLVQAGEEVKKGTGLLILEAMKMENEVKADHAGKVIAVHCTPGRPVEKGEPLFIIHYEH